MKQLILQIILNTVYQVIKDFFKNGSDYSFKIDLGAYAILDDYDQISSVIAGIFGIADNPVNSIYSYKNNIIFGEGTVEDICFDTAWAAEEEIFGPVLTVITYKDLDEAIDIANNSKYGLSSYISSDNEKTAYEIAKRIKAGQTIINKPSRGSVPAPFGGFKMSGNGREHGVFGLEEYLEIKAII